MTPATRFARELGVEFPIVQAPMGGSAGGALAAAVANAGGLGMVGGGRGDHDWLTGELELVTSSTDKPWGIGFLAWAVSMDAIEHALDFDPVAVMFSFGDAAPFAPVVRDAGVRLVVQVVDMDEARQALDLGADVIVAQGRESGGHGARHGRSTLSFVPAVVDLARGVPVLAAGGIVDGRGIAAMLALGASGVLLGSRFQATREALVDPAVIEIIVRSTGEDTERNNVLDILRGSDWPRRYAARAVADRFVHSWKDREHDIGPGAKAEYMDAVQRGEIPQVPVWVDESVDLIHDVRPAGEVMSELVAGAIAAVERIGHWDAGDARTHERSGDPGEG